MSEQERADMAKAAPRNPFGTCLACALIAGAMTTAALAQPGAPPGPAPSGSSDPFAGLPPLPVMPPEIQARIGSPSTPGRLEGVWKIVGSSTELRPLSGPVPFTAEGKKRYDENKMLRAQGKIDDYDIASSRCSSPGVPRLMLTPMRFKIWERQSVVTFDFEWNRAIRQVDLRGAEHMKPLVPDMNGIAAGQWDGDTLVITTTDISERTLIDDLAPHTDAMKVTERLRLVDPDTLENRITIDDPATFTKPWEAVITYKRQPNALFPEDVCMDRLRAKQPAFPKPSR